MTGASICMWAYQLLPAFHINRQKSLLYFLTFALILPICCIYFNLYHSHYYRGYLWLQGQLEPNQNDFKVKLMQQLIADNDERIDNANRFMKTFCQKLSRSNGSTESSNWDVPENSCRASVLNWGDMRPKATVLITVISSKRIALLDTNQPLILQYLTQNVAKWLEMIEKINTNGHAKKYKLTICSVGSEITKEEEHLKEIVPLFRSSGASLKSSDFGPYHDKLAWPYEKEKRDYAFCLNKVQTQYKPEYILVVEDDALPLDHALKTLDHWINYLSRRSARYSYLKLYHPKRLQGFESSEAERIPQLLGISVVLGTLFSCIESQFMPAILGTAKQTYSFWMLLSWFVYSALVAVAIGRPHLERWRSSLSPHFHYIVPDPFCCTQAVLYSGESARDFSRYLGTVICNETFHKDDALWSYNLAGRLNHGSGRLLQPNLFHHVGFWSSLRSGFVDPLLILE